MRVDRRFCEPVCVSKQELQNCNFVKSILMIAVILDHSLAFWAGGKWFNQAPVWESQALGMVSRWLGCFHTYCFTLVSGYIFYAMKFEYKSEKYQNYVSFITGKINRLLVPYCFVVIVWAAPATLFWFRGGIVRKYIFMESPSQLWFLIMLFNVFILYYPIANFIDRHIFWGAIIVLGEYGLGVICSHFLPNIFQIWAALRYMFFFFVGAMIRKLGTRMLRKIPVIIYIVFDIILFAGYMIISDKSGWYLKAISHGILFLLRSTGAVGAFVVLQKFAETPFLPSEVRGFFSKYSMTIYLFHQQLIYITLALGNGHINNYCLAIINFLFALTGASGIAVFLYKFSATRYLVTGRS